MDISEIVSIISTVGFPIVMCVTMFKYIATLTDTHKEEIKLLKDSMSSNLDKYKDYFDKYNNEVINKLKRACNYHNLPFELVEPSTIKGIKKMLGVWDFEGVYDQFKTLGAKRYMVKHKGALKVDGKEYDYSLTVSGLNKQKAIPYLIYKYGNDIMNVFNDNLYISPMGTGKNIHTYIDYPIEGELCDYMGNVSKFFEHTGIHLEPTDYTLSLSIMFLDYILGKHLKQ